MVRERMREWLLDKYQVHKRAAHIYLYLRNTLYSKLTKDISISKMSYHESYKNVFNHLTKQSDRHRNLANILALLIGIIRRK